MNSGNVRAYGIPPYTVALLHGGPGAPGYMAPVARALASEFGILEPLQGANSLEGQIEELVRQLLSFDIANLTLVGSSWGAVLALFVAARKELPVRKLVLIGSAVFDAESSDRTKKNRLQRMSESDQTRFRRLQHEISRSEGAERNHLFTELAKIFDSTDFYDPISTDLEVTDVQENINRRVWTEFVELRDQPGDLKDEFSKIKVPISIIHGSFDPHPLTGVEPFLKNCVSDVTAYVLDNCGHYPWMEKQARDEFFTVLKSELE